MRGYFTRTPKNYSIEDTPQIDNDETLRRFGYPATAISPSGTRKVVCKCERCGVILERIRIRVRPPVLCHSCSKTKYDRDAPAPLVDAEETLKQFGYTVESLPRAGTEKVVGICSVCRGRYHVRIKSVREGMKCRPCLRADICKTQFAPRENDGGKNLNEEETVKQFGYSAISLSPKSFSMVIANCSICGTTYRRIRRNVNDYSKCIACARNKIDHKKLQNKRHKTLQEHYPEGLPHPLNLGQTASLLGDFLSATLGRDITREKILSNGQRLDLYDPQTNIGIEYCGLYWHNEHSLTPRGGHYHADKMLAAQKDGYKLITVFEDEYIEREEAVKNRLLVILGNNKKVVQARKCQITLVEASIAKEFIDKHHIQGSPPTFKYTFGLVHENNLLGVMTGGDHHRQGHKKELVLSRLCFAPQVHVTGGSKRLFKKLCDQGRLDGYVKIITWSDNRWTDGDVYSRLSMNVITKIPPDYSYVKINKPGKRFSKQSQQKKHTGCPPEITEREWAYRHGFSRIWDCGHLKWEFTL